MLLASRINIDQIYRVLMFLPCVMQVQKEYRLSLARILISKYQSIVDDRMQMTRTSNMVNVLEEVARNNIIVL